MVSSASCQSLCLVGRSEMPLRSGLAVELLCYFELCEH